MMIGMKKKKRLAIEKQVIVNWMEPWEDTPPVGQTVLATVTGTGPGILCDHALINVKWNGENSGWEMEEVPLDEFIVHAWCDIEPYRGG